MDPWINSITCSIIYASLTNVWIYSITCCIICINLMNLCINSIICSIICVHLTNLLINCKTYSIICVNLMILSVSSFASLIYFSFLVYIFLRFFFFPLFASITSPAENLLLCPVSILKLYLLPYPCHTFSFMYIVPIVIPHVDVAVTSKYVFE